MAGSVNKGRGTVTRAWYEVLTLEIQRQSDRLLFWEAIQWHLEHGDLGEIIEANLAHCKELQEFQKSQMAKELSSEDEKGERS